MSNVQDCLVDWKSWDDWLENDEIEIDDLRNLFKIIDDKCDDEVITHVLSQLKEEHVVNAFFCYDVLIFDNEYFKFVRHWTSIVQLIKIDQIKKILKNVKRVRERNVHLFVVYFAEQFDDVLLHCDRRIFLIVDRNEFRERCVKDERRFVSYVVMKADRV
jgi:hypothetical protein